MLMEPELIFGCLLSYYSANSDNASMKEDLKMVPQKNSNPSRIKSLQVQINFYPVISTDS